MKKLSIILSALFISLPFFSLAQHNHANGDLSKDCCKQKQQSTVPKVTKGYYAIGNNAQKLATGKSCCIHDGSIAKRNVSKGFYAIGDNNKKLPANNNELVSGSATTPVSKGYYAIGNNAVKLGLGKAACCCCFD